MSNIDMSCLISSEDKKTKAATEKQIKINADALAYLANTDWYVLREAETAIEIPKDIQDRRANSRNAIVAPAQK